MSLDYTINGYNPINISRICARAGRRYGTHPYKSKLFEKKHPIIAMFFNPCSPDIFDGFYHPSVEIYGANGRLLESISCRSNKQAQELRDSMIDKLNYFLENAIAVDRTYR